MTIEEMHYDFKKKFNKIDSQQNRNLRVPEVDWTLNEALKLFVKMIAQPRVSQHLGFEVSQRSIDDIRELVVDPIDRDNIGFDIYNYPTTFTVKDNQITLPKEYWFFLKGYVEMKKGNCIKEGQLYIRRHEEEFEESPLDRSSFEWREVNGVFYRDRIKVFNDGTFKNTRVFLSYVRRPKYMHFAEGHSPQGYKLPSGVSLVGRSDCELSEQTHSEIVDIAVLLASAETQSTNLQESLLKFKMDQLQ